MVRNSLFVALIFITHKSCETQKLGIDVDIFGRMTIFAVDYK